MFLLVRLSGNNEVSAYFRLFFEPVVLNQLLIADSPSSPLSLFLHCSSIFFQTHYVDPEGWAISFKNVHRPYRHQLPTNVYENQNKLLIDIASLHLRQPLLCFLCLSRPSGYTKGHLLAFVSSKQYMIRVPFHYMPLTS